MPDLSDEYQSKNAASVTRPIHLDLTEKGRPRATLANVMAVIEQHPCWQEALGLDELLNDVVLRTRPPYLTGEEAWTPRVLTEHDASEAAIWLQRRYALCTSTAVVNEGLATYAQRFPFHPIRDYLARLTWDGQPRLDYWLSRYCHTAETPYVRAVASKTLIAAVARAENPGCKVDTMTILEGKQGFLKSTVWNTLASDAWFTDWLPDMHDKDAAQTLCGKWFIELGELSAFQRSEIETVKRFLSAKQDHYRPSYGKRAATFPRQNIFVGSTNEDHYFKDSTGNRRFWPVKLTGECDVIALQRDRDQLWAEAVVRYHQGERWYLTGNLERASTLEQAERIELDDWEGPIRDFIAQPLMEGDQPYITTHWILEQCFQIENKLLWTQAHTKRIGSIVRRHGWTAKKLWVTTDTGRRTQLSVFVPVATDRTAEGHDTEETGTSTTYALCTGCTCRTCYIHMYGERRCGVPKPSLETGVRTGTTGTPVRIPDSEATNGSVLDSRHFPPGDHSHEAGEVPSRGPESPKAPEGLALDGFSHANILPKPGGKSERACAPADGLRCAVTGGAHQREQVGKAWCCKLCRMWMTPPLKKEGV